MAAPTRSLSAQMISEAGMSPTTRRSGLDAHERDFARRKREAGVGIANIAKMMGRPEADVRAFFDVGSAAAGEPAK